MSGDGSSSTTMAMLCIAFLKRRGIEASASATRLSKCFRSTSGFPARCRRRVGGARLRDDETEVIAVILHGALIAQRLGPADAAAVKNQRIRRPRPAVGRQPAAQLLLDDNRIVGVGDADAVRHPQHVAV